MRLLFAALLLAGCGAQTTTLGDSGTDGSPADGIVTDTTPTADAPAIDYFSCTQPTDCTLAIHDCCGSCGVQKLVDYTAINKAKSSEWRTKVCPVPSTTCPGCAVMIEKSLMALCLSGKCTGVDIRTDPVSECATDADCVLRTSECCECGGDAANPIALARSKLDAYMSKVCTPGPCADCAPVYPSTIKAVCDATKHCVAKRL